MKKEAGEVVQTLVRDFPDSAEALALMASVCFRDGDTEKAMSCWKRCLELDPHRADVYEAMSLVALKKGEYSHAEALARRALQIEPYRPGVRYRLASARMYLGRPEEAVPALEEEVEISPASADAYYLLGQSQFQLKHYGEAERSYKKALQLQPCHKNACYGLAVVCARLGKEDEAQRYRAKFQKLKAADIRALIAEEETYDDLAVTRGKTADVHVDAGRIYDKRASPAKAEQHWQRAAAIDPGHTTSRLNLAAMYQASGRNRQALDVCEQLTKIDPENAHYHFNVGVLRARLGRFDDAERAFRKVVELAPDDAQGYSALAGLCLRETNEYSKARSFAEKAVRLRPVASNYALLSEACEKSGDHSGAVAAMRQAVELDPGSVKYARILRVLQPGEMMR